MTLNLCNVCQKEANQKCGKCQSVFYCSKEHQTTDWKKHKTCCYPIAIFSNSEVGRHLIATKDLGPNDIILKEKPLIFGPPQETLPVCLGCNQQVYKNSHRACSKCGWPVCSLECEMKFCHLPECYYTAKRGEKVVISNFDSPHPLYQCIVPLRILYQKNNNPILWEKLSVLESHDKERKLTTKFVHEKEIALQILKFFKLENEFSLEEILHAFGILLVNAHEIPLSDPPHIAIYEKSSMFENNCRANCNKSFTDKGEIYITAGMNIKKGDHLNICYADPLWSTPNRRTFLNETKFFWCSCERCSDPTEFGTYFSAVRCQNGTCDGNLLPKSFLGNVLSTTWCCCKCPYTVTQDLINELCNKVGEDLQNLDKTNVFSCRSFIKKLNKILPENNFYMIEVKLALSQLIGQDTPRGLSGVSNEDLEQKREICQELIKLTNVLVPSEKRLRGLLLFELHSSLTEIAQRKSKNYQNIQHGFEELKESKKVLQESIDLLKFEPSDMPEGKIYLQAVKNLANLNNLLIRLNLKI